MFRPKQREKNLQKQITIWQLDHIIFYFFRKLDRNCQQIHIRMEKSLFIPNKIWKKKSL